MSEEIRCPNCAEKVKQSAIMCRFCQRGLSSSHFKKCRFCGEMVRRAAQRCRFCSSSLPDYREESGEQSPAMEGPPHRVAVSSADIEDSEQEDLIECPCCSELIQKLAILCRFCQTGLSRDLFSKCQYCDEMIRTESTFCRSCKSARSSPAGGPAPGISSSPPPVWQDSFAPSVAIFDRPPRKRDKGPSFGSGAFGNSVRDQVFEVVVRQALAGAPWQNICAGPMQMNNITVKEIEDEVKRRRDLLSR